MLTSKAYVETDRPSRYLVQLCRHFTTRVGTYPTGCAPTKAVRRTCAPRAGARRMVRDSRTVNFGWGRCTISHAAWRPLPSGPLHTE